MLLVAIGIPGERLAASENIALAAEATDALHDARVLTEGLRLRELQLGFGRTVLEEILQFLVGGGLDGLEVHAGFHSECQNELPSDFGVGIVGGGAGSNLVLVNQALIEARSLAVAEDLRGEIEKCLFLGICRGNVPHAIEARLRHAILYRIAVSAGALCDPVLGMDDRGTWRNAAIILFDFLARNFGRNVAGNDQGNVVRTVVGLEPFLHIAHRGSIQIFHGTDGRPGIGVADRIGVLSEKLSRDTVGLVFSLALFVLHYAALEIKFFLVQDREQMSHAIAFREESVIEHGRRDIFKVIGAVTIGGAIEIGRSNSFHGVYVGVVEIFATAEHEVFEQVSEAGLAWFFVLGADVVPGVYGDDGRFVIFMNQNREPVGENKLGVRNIGNSHGCPGSSCGARLWRGGLLRKSIGLRGR